MKQPARRVYPWQHCKPLHHPSAQQNFSLRINLLNYPFEPFSQLLKPKCTLLKQVHKVSIGLIGISFDVRAVEPQKGIGHEERCALVAVHKWVVVRQALHQCRGLVEQALVVTELWAHECGFERAHISDARGSPERLDQQFVDRQHFLKGRGLAHY